MQTIYLDGAILQIPIDAVYEPAIVPETADSEPIVPEPESE